MMKVRHFLTILDNYFPFNKQEEWDKSGLIFGNLNQKLRNFKILLALDLTIDCLKYAIKNSIFVIVTHHPFIFEESVEEEILKKPYKIEMINLIKKMKFIIISLHTNYDKHSKGMKEALRNIIPWKEKKISLPYGVSFNADLDLKEVKSFFKKTLRIKIINQNVFNKKTKYSKIILIPGSGCEIGIKNYLEHECDLLITSDVKWSDWIMARDLSVNILQISHQIEEIWIQHFKKILEKHNKELIIKTFYLEKGI